MCCLCDEQQLRDGLPNGKIFSPMQPSDPSDPAFTQKNIEGQVFKPAPLGKRVRWMAWLVFAVLSLFVGMHLWLLLRFPAAGASPLAWVALALAPVLVGLVWHGARIRYYLIDGDCLVVDRAFFPVRIDLHDYELVHEFTGVVGDVRKIIGNDGLGAISGHFKSQEHGALRIYASNLFDAVMLEGPSGKLLVSPADHPAFLESVLHHLHTRKGGLL